MIKSFPFKRQDTEFTVTICEGNLTGFFELLVKWFYGFALGMLKLKAVVFILQSENSYNVNLPQIKLMFSNIPRITILYWVLF